MLSTRGKVTSGDIVGLSQGVTKQQITNCITIKEAARLQHHNTLKVMSCIQKLYKITGDTVVWLPAKGNSILHVVWFGYVGTKLDI